MAIYNGQGELIDIEAQVNTFDVRIIRAINNENDAYRIATYNIYGAGYAQRNWERLKEQLFEYGLDFCAMQEVKDAQGTVEGNDTVQNKLTSWMLPYTDTLGELYPTNCRSLLSRFPVVSSFEFAYEKWNNDHRYLAKYEVTLPRFKERIGSEDLKMSIYNTQLDFNWANIVQYEIAELVNAVSQDPNPFIVICMDSNDASEEKLTWAAVENAGFTHCIDKTAKTVIYDSICLDQIFVNGNMESLHYDAIDSNSFRFSSPPHNNAPISDHDLCFADVRLLYDNIYCVKEELTHVTSDIESPHVERGEGFTAHYTVDSGYEIHNVVIWVIDENYKIQDTVWDETTLTVNIPANLVTNDIFIRIDAIKIVETGGYGVGIPSGYSGSLDTTRRPSATNRIEMTVNIPSWENLTNMTLASWGVSGIKAIKDTDSWAGLISGTYASDKLPSEIIGQGKVTVTFSNIAGDNGVIRIPATVQRSVPNMTIYEIKGYKNDTLVYDLLASNEIGLMKETITGDIYEFDIKEGLTVVSP